MSVENDMFHRYILLALFLVECFTIVSAVETEDPVQLSKKSLLREVTLDLSVRSIQCVFYITNYKHSQEVISGLSVPLIFHHYNK